jgi:hypothetical protein
VPGRARPGEHGRHVDDAQTVESTQENGSVKQRSRMRPNA